MDISKTKKEVKSVSQLVFAWWDGEYDRPQFVSIIAA